MSIKTNIFLRNVPRVVKDHFKAYCAKRGRSMNSMLVDFMKSVIQRDQSAQKEDEWVKGGQK